MPYVNVRILDDGVTAEQKAEVIAGITEIMVRVLNKNPESTFVVIDEVPLDNWGFKGKPVSQLRRQPKDGSQAMRRGRAPHAGTRLAQSMACR